MNEGEGILTLSFCFTYFEAPLPLEVNSPYVNTVIDLYFSVDNSTDTVHVVKLIGSLLF